MSRNQREGHYYGWTKGSHIRAHRSYRSAWGLSSWHSYQVYTDRDIIRSNGRSWAYDAA